MEGSRPVSFRPEGAAKSGAAKVPELVPSANTDQAGRPRGRAPRHPFKFQPALKPVSQPAPAAAPVEPPLSPRSLRAQTLHDARVEASFCSAREAMSEIVPGFLWLGTAECASRNVEELTARGITWVLNMAGENIVDFDAARAHFRTRVPDGEYLVFAAADRTDYNVSQHFRDALAFIEKAREEYRRSLVHCFAGVSRSASIVIAYLMKRNGWNLDEALNAVASRRPCIRPNISFMRQLIAFEEELSSASRNTSSADNQ